MINLEETTVGELQEQLDVLFEEWWSSRHIFNRHYDEDQRNVLYGGFKSGFWNAIQFVLEN